MASYSSVWTVDYQGAKATNFIGTIATTANTGALVVGKRRLIRIFLQNQTSPATASQYAIRFTLGLSTGTVAPTPDSTAPFFTSNQEFTIDTGDLYDEINLANLAADNGSVTIAYAIVPLSKF